MKRIYRIQDSDGLGPYRPRTRAMFREMRERHDEDRIGHPTPYQDVPISGVAIDAFMMHRLKCGFDSIRQLLNWFSFEELRLMRAHGFRVVSFPEPPGTLYFAKQCVFPASFQTKGK